MTTESNVDTNQSPAEAREWAQQSIASKVADFQATHADAAARSRKELSEQNPLSADEQLALLQEQTFEPIPFRVSAEAMAHITDPDVIDRAIRSAELADDVDWSTTWKHHQYRLNQQAENAAVDLADIERMNTIAEGVRDLNARKELGLIGTLGEEEIARREAEIAQILALESTIHGALESVEELEETIALTEAQFADPGERPHGWDEWRAKHDFEQLVAKRDQIKEIRSRPRVDPNISAAQMTAEAQQSIADKLASLAR